MREFKYVIKDQLGIHARPAGLLAKMAKKYESAIIIQKGDKKVQASQLLMLMSLGVKHGEEVMITAQGSDEDTAYEELKNFFQTNL